MRAVERKAAKDGLSVSAYCRLVLARDAGVDVVEEEIPIDERPIYRCRRCPESRATGLTEFKAHNLRYHPEVGVVQ